MRESPLHPAQVAELIERHNAGLRGHRGASAPLYLTPPPTVEEAGLPPEIEAELARKKAEWLGEPDPGLPEETPEPAPATAPPAAPRPVRPASVPDPEQPAFNREPEILYLKFTAGLVTLHTTAGRFTLNKAESRTVQITCVAAMERSLDEYAKAMKARYQEPEGE